jgi:hypothetical protein
MLLAGDGGGCASEPGTNGRALQADRARRTPDRHHEKACDGRLLDRRWMCALPVPGGGAVPTMQGSAAQRHGAALCAHVWQRRCLSPALRPSAGSRLLGVRGSQDAHGWWTHGDLSGRHHSSKMRAILDVVKRPVSLNTITGGTLQLCRPTRRLCRQDQARITFPPRAPAPIDYYLSQSRATRKHQELNATEPA